MSVRVVSVTTDPLAGVPLSAARSSVFWPGREVAEWNLAPGFAATALPCSPLQALAAAVTCVFHRYHGDEATLGLVSADGAVRMLRLSLDPEDLVRAVVAAVAEVLVQPPGAPLSGEDGTPPFGTLLSEGSSALELPELRQDVGLSFDARGARLSCAYNSRLFDHRSIKAFLGHVERYLWAIAKTPAGPVGEVDYLSAAEVAMAAAMSQPKEDWSEPAETAQAMFERAAAEHPHSIALEAEGEAWTYARLEALSRSVACGLREKGLERGAVVALAVRPGAWQVAGVLGVLRAGMTPLPLDYSFPSDRLRKIIDLGRPDFLLGDGALKAEAGAGLPADTVKALASAASGPLPASRLDDLAYLLFTSGSTGVPKGVAMGQRTLANLVRWQALSSEGAGARTLNRSSIAFDVGFQEIFSTLCFGHTLVVASEAERADIVGLTKLLEERRIDRVFLPPVSLLQLAESLRDVEADLLGLRQVVTAGETLRITPAVIRMFRTCPARLTNQYGPTETHVATSHDLSGPP
jgi:non-ribosomal peptide synthetase component F